MPIFEQALYFFLELSKFLENIHVYMLYVSAKVTHKRPQVIKNLTKTAAYCEPREIHALTRLSKNSPCYGIHI